MQTFLRIAKVIDSPDYIAPSFLQCKKVISKFLGSKQYNFCRGTEAGYDLAGICRNTKKRRLGQRINRGKES
jgi:hypothetical protein